MQSSIGLAALLLCTLASTRSILNSDAGQPGAGSTTDSSFGLDLAQAIAQQSKRRTFDSLLPASNARVDRLVNIQDAKIQALRTDSDGKFDYLFGQANLTAAQITQLQQEYESVKGSKAKASSGGAGAAVASTQGFAGVAGSPGPAQAPLAAASQESPSGPSAAGAAQVPVAPGIEGSPTPATSSAGEGGRR